MEWFFGLFLTLWALVCLWSKKNRNNDFKVKKKSFYITRRKPQKPPFYNQIPTTRIKLYQDYIDRAFQFSPTLEFKHNDERFNRLLTEAANNDDLSEIDLELMRIQYVLADKALREAHRPSWAAKVINRHEKDFFPSPWTVLSSLFAGHKQNMSSSHPKSVH